MVVSNHASHLDAPLIIGALLVVLSCAIFGCSLALTLSVWGKKTHEVLLATYAFGIFWLLSAPIWAGLVWMLMSVAFSVYVGHFGTYDRTYGQLGAIVGFMTWIWLSLAIVLLGAEFNCELEEQVGAQPEPPSRR